MTIRENTPNNRKITPLWVITIFLTFTESVLGIAATQVTGGIQVALIVFVIVFPLLVAIGFFALLWFKPHHFYSPSDFNGEVGAREYIEAMSQQKSFDENRLYDDIKGAINSSILSDKVINELIEKVSDEAGEKVKEEVAKVLEKAADNTVEAIRKSSFITIDSTPLLGTKGKIWQVPCDEYLTVSKLLNVIWYAHENDLPVYAYQKFWVLRDAITHHIFNNIEHLRTLEEARIFPGMRLELIKVK